jgi:hypothetical protein
MGFKADSPKEGPSQHYLRARGFIKKPEPVPQGRGQNRPRKPPNPAVLVYFIRAVTVGLIKIGKADCVHTRFRTLRANSPDTLQLLGCIASENGNGLERELHKRFAEHQSHGEWFRPAPALLEFIAENAGPVPPMRDWRKTRYGDG